MLLGAGAAALVAGAPARAQAEEKDKPAAETSKNEAIAPPKRSVTKHSGRFNGQSVSYKATAGETYLKDKDGKPLAAIFSISYVKDGKDPNRPVTFLFNGGPGSGSLWLHMGAFGPKRVAIPSDARDDGAPPYPIVDNPESLLDVTDIVFIDPVGTGFSHALGKTDPKDYWGVTKDAKSIAEFIRIWLNENGRWNAPKYLGGESYGTTRSAAVAQRARGRVQRRRAQRRHPDLDRARFRLRVRDAGQRNVYITNLPTMAATACTTARRSRPRRRRALSRKHASSRSGPSRPPCSRAERWRARSARRCAAS